MEINYRKITSQEISQLYQFTRKHYVEYYDVQTELVDHLATGMEERWEKQPALSFDKNLQLEFKKFGIYGFSEVVKKRQAAMNKKYRKLIWEEFKSAIKQPSVFLATLLLFVICIFLMGTEKGYGLLIHSLVVLSLIQLAYVLRLHNINGKRRKEQNKKFLLEDIILNVGSASVLFILPINTMNMFSFAELSAEPFWKFFLALFISIITLLSYICLFQLPKKKDEILQKAYPELKFNKAGN